MRCGVVNIFKKKGFNQDDPLLFIKSCITYKYACSFMKIPQPCIKKTKILVKVSNRTPVNFFKLVL